MLAVISLLCLAAIGLAACGDDDDGGSSGGGTDAAYTSSVCKSFAKFTATLTKVDLNAKEDVQTKALTDALDAYVKDIKAAKPPSDVKSYHDGIVKQFEDVLTKLKNSKDQKVLEDFTPNKPPEAIKARLAKALADNPDCKDSGFSFEN